MKKLLGISLVAVLAATPLMASADTNPSAYALTSGANGESGQTYNETTTPKAAAGKYFKGKTVSDADAGIVATGAYVKGAYNAAISAINAVAEDTATSAGAGINKTSGKFSLDVTKGANDANISGLQFDGSGDDATVSIKAGDGIAVDASGVAVNLSSNKGLQIDSANKTLEIKDGAGIKTGANGVEVDLITNGGLNTDDSGQLGVVVDGTTVELNASGQLQVKNAGDYATKTGVVNTIESATVHTLNNVSVASSGVTAYTDWNDESEQTGRTTLAQTTLSTSEAYVPVVITATKSDPSSNTYDVKYHTTKVDVANDQTTSPNTYVAPAQGLGD